jgi:hypothetical protein
LLFPSQYPADSAIKGLRGVVSPGDRPHPYAGSPLAIRHLVEKPGGEFCRTDQTIDDAETIPVKRRIINL